MRYSKAKRRCNLGLCEQERLSTVTETQLELPENYRSAIPSVTRQQFQDITQPLLERLWTPMAAVAADVMLEWVKKPSWVGDEVLKVCVTGA